MNYDKLLEQNDAVIIKLWFEKTVADYPAEAAKFIKDVKNRFANPVGNATFDALAKLFAEIITDADKEKLILFFDPVLRIRAVQSFSASKSVGFVFFLKEIVRNVLYKKITGSKKENKDIEDYLCHFNKRVDKVALIAFDVYMSCREKIFHLKATEERNITFSAFERAGLVREIPKEENQDLL